MGFSRSLKNEVRGAAGHTTPIGGCAVPWVHGSLRVD